MVERVHQGSVKCYSIKRVFFNHDNPWARLSRSIIWGQGVASQEELKAVLIYILTDTKNDQGSVLGLASGEKT